MRKKSAGGSSVLELAHRLGREEALVVGRDARVVALGEHEVDLVVVEQQRLAAARDRHLRELAAGGALGRPAQRAAQPLDGLRQPLLGDGLEQVVERVDRERLHGVVLVRGHEDDVAGAWATT